MCEKVRSGKAVEKRYLAKRVKSLFFRDSCTLSGGFSEAKGSQNGVKMDDKTEENGTKSGTAGSQTDFVRLFSGFLRVLQAYRILAQGLFF